MSETSAPSVALLGTGIMGAGMARNLARAGLRVRAWNRTPERAEPLRADGVQVVESVAAAVAGADVVVTMLWDAESVEATLREAAGSFSDTAVLAQMSTVGVTGAARLAALAGELGLAYVDAPVLGTRGPAEQGTLVVLASGPESARATVTPVFEAVGSRTLWVGEAGTGSRLKLSANAFVITLLGGIAQSIALCRSLGVDPQLFLDAIEGGAMDSPYVRIKGGSMLAEDFSPSFGLAGALKDAGLIAAAARDAGTDPSLIEALQAQQSRAVDAGHGEADMAAVIKAYG